MNKPYSQLAETLTRTLEHNDVGLPDQTGVVSMLLGETIGNSLSIPSSAVDSPSSWYRSYHKQNVMDVMNQINEAFVIDMDDVEALTYKLWLTRYQLVHEPGLTANALMQKMLEDGYYELPTRFTELARKYRTAHTNIDLIEAYKNGNKTV